MKRPVTPLLGLAPVLVAAATACGGNGGGVVVETAGGDAALNCGNDLVEPGEECDGTEDCTSECLFNVCGDAELGPNEKCDDGNDENADSCTASCELGPLAIVDIAVGEYHACATSLSGRIKCWGAADMGRLGQPGYEESIGDDEPPSDWDDVQAVEGIVALTAGRHHTCGLLASGDVACWGNNGSYQLGYGHRDNIGSNETPRSAGSLGLSGIVGLAAGDSHTCALASSGDVTCWGSGGSGQLGYGDGTTGGDGELAGSFGAVALQEAAVQITAGESHTCARLESGAVTCWGSNAVGQLGTGQVDSIGDDETPASIPTIDLGGTAIDIDAGGNSTCAALDDGTLRCWGSNTSRKLGNGTAEDVGDRKTPAEEGVVLFEGDAVDVEVGSSHVCAMTAAGAVHCWGRSDSVGYEDAETYAPPGRAVQLGTTATTLEIGRSTSCAITSAAGVRCWGDNTGGILGQPNSGSSVLRNPSMYGDVDVFSL